jgi:hypothetical protein
MSSSWKIGAVSGLVAGIASGLIVFISDNILAGIGLSSGMVYFNEILVNLIWGLIFGVIFSRIYNMIPGKGILKGLCYGLLVFLFIGFRESIWIAAYASHILAMSIGFADLLASITYGLILGMLYYEPARTFVRPDMTKGTLAGIIAGILGGIAAYLMQIIDNIYVYKLGTAWMDPSFILSQLSVHLGVHAIYGGVFGAIFVCVYDMVPKKGLSKAIVYGLIAFLVTDVHFAFRYILYALTVWPEILGENIGTLYIGFVAFLVFGIVLGYLYKPGD